MNDISQLTVKNIENIEIKQIQFHEFQDGVKKWLNFHINWQNDMDYMEKTENNTYYGAYFNNKLQACICINAAGKISFLFVDKEYRRRGTAVLKRVR